MRREIILCDCCSSKALIYQWDKWLCHKHWREERDRQEEKEYKLIEGEISKKCSSDE